MINDRKLQMYKINKITLCNDYLINVIDYRSFHSILIRQRIHKQID